MSSRSIAVAVLTGGLLVLGPAVASAQEVPEIPGEVPGGDGLNDLLDGVGDLLEDPQGELEDPQGLVEDLVDDLTGVLDDLQGDLTGEEEPEPTPEPDPEPEPAPTDPTPAQPETAPDQAAANPSLPSTGGGAMALGAMGLMGGAALLRRS